MPNAGTTPAPPPPAYVVASIRPTAVPDASVAASNLDSNSTTYPFLLDDPLASQLALLKHLPGGVYRTLRSALPHSLGSLPTTERIRVWAVRDTSSNTLRIHVFRRNVLRVVDSEPVANGAGSIPLDPMSMAAPDYDSRPPPPAYSTIARGDVPLDLVRTLPRASQPLTTHPQPNARIVNMPASAPTLARGTPVPFSAIRLGVIAIAANPTQPLSADGHGQCVCPLDSALVIDDGVDLLDNGTRPAVSLYVNSHEIHALRKWAMHDLPKAQRASGGRSFETVAAHQSSSKRSSGCDSCCEAFCCPRYGGYSGSCCDSTLWACFVTEACANLCSLVASCFEAIFDGCGAACACCCETTGQMECDPECFCCCFALLN